MQFTSRNLFCTTAVVAISVGTLLVVIRNFRSPFINIPIGVLAACGFFGAPVVLPVIGFLTGRYVLEIRGMDMLAFLFISLFAGLLLSVLCYYLLGLVVLMQAP